jgi:hypothetical protein
VIVLSLTILGFAGADLVRWSPERVSGARTAMAVLAAAVLTLVPACLSGLPARDAVLLEVGILPVVLVWLLFDQYGEDPRSDQGQPSCDAEEGRPPHKVRKVGPGYQLAWILAALVAAFALSGLTGAIAGALGRWYSDLPFGFTRTIDIDQFLLGSSAALFVLATSNRIVRLVLQAAGPPGLMKGETKLSGGRILGPMERLFVAAMVVSGNLTAAAALIAAKGFLRLPEIRSNADQRGGVGDQVTEYFLIGTFASLLIASALGAIVLGAG